MKKDENQLGRVWVLMLFTLLFCLGAYFFPDRIAGYSLKRLDLLSDFSDTRSTIELMDSLRQQLAMEIDSVEVDSVAMSRSQPLALIQRRWLCGIHYIVRCMLSRERIVWEAGSRITLWAISV